MSPYWTKERIIGSIKLWNKTYGHPPGWRDWSTRKTLPGDYPVSTTVRQTFGSWNAAIEAAGFTPVPPQTPPQLRRKPIEKKPKTKKLEKKPKTASERRERRIEALRLAIEKEESVSDPIEFVGVTIEFAGSFPTPDGVTLNAMMDEGANQCTFTVTSFAATESGAKDQMDQFLGALIKAITPQ